MVTAADPATLDPISQTGDGATSRCGPDCDGLRCLGLPVRALSVSLLNLLLHDGTVDLELTSSVVALDPGLAFTTVQLANRERRDGDELIWQFPLAVVAVGQHRLLQAVNQAPKIESYPSVSVRGELRLIWERAVVRACLARFLGHRLGSGNPRQAFLTGLLFELPTLIRLTYPSSPEPQLGLLAGWRQSLPPETDAAIDQVHDDIDIHADSHTHAHPHSEDRPQTSLTANLLLAELLLRSTLRGTSPGPEKGRQLASHPVWQCWRETSMQQRHLLLDHSRELARWAACNAPAMNPWEFTAKLERSKGWK